MARLSNSTITVKKEHLKCGCFDYNFSHGRCRQHTIIDNLNKKESKEIQEQEDLSGLIQDADALISRWVRISRSDKDGLCKCFTCNNKVRWQELHCGHFIPRANIRLRHDTRNLRPQCFTCNVTKRGMLAIFAQRLEWENEGVVEMLVEESRIIHHVTREELRAIISDTSQKLSKLKHHHDKEI
jgi:hypothetical protein